MTSDPQKATRDDSRTLDYGALAVGGLLLLLLLCAAASGALFLFQRFAIDEPPPGPTAEPPPDPAIPQAPPADRAAQEAARMRARYRPGSHVEVVGLLPSGFSDLRRLAAGNQGGHRVDMPWIVAGAELRAGSSPTPTDGPGPAMRLRPRDATGSPLVVIPGSPTRLSIHAQSSPGANGAVQGLLIDFPGYEGHFFLPAVANSELGPVRVAGVDEAELFFGIDAPVRPGGGPAPPDKEMRASMRVAAVDIEGRISPFVTRELRVLPVGTGDVEVTLSMTEATDLDLYVVDPAGTLIYYGNSSALSGGQLDLDANAGCGTNMGVNNEHIYWPQGAAPAGTYQVRVAHYENCVGGRDVDYRVTVRNCGETAVLSGHFEGDGDSRNCDVDPGSDTRWCQQVVSFDVTPCD